MLRLVWVLLIVACGKSGTTGDGTASQADALVEHAARLTERLELVELAAAATAAERLAGSADLARALSSFSQERSTMARLGFAKFVAREVYGTPRADILALVDLEGSVVAMHEVASVVPKQWRSTDPARKTIIPALNAALAGTTVAEVWVDTSMYVVAAAPVVDATGNRIGAVVFAHARTADSARVRGAMLGVDVAFTDDKRVWASSFTRASETEDTARAAELGKALATLAPGAKQKIAIGDAQVLAVRVRSPRWSSGPVPSDPPGSVVVLAPVETLKPSHEVAAERLAGAYQLVQRLEFLEALELSREAGRLASHPALAAAIKNEADRAGAQSAFATLAKRTPSAIVVALVDALGKPIASPSPPAFTWQLNSRGPDLAPLDAALGDPLAIAETMVIGGKLYRVAVASVVDRSVAVPLVIGAVVLGYPVDDGVAKSTSELLRLHVAYTDDKKVHAASLASPGLDTLTTLETGKHTVTLAGTSYTAAQVGLPRSASRSLPDTYPPKTTRIVLLAPIPAP